jgi:hypothetical protein
MATTRLIKPQQQILQKVNQSAKLAAAKMPAPRLVTFRLKNSEKNMRQINPFYVQKALDSIAGKVKNASRLKNGTLLIEVHKDKQAELLLKATFLGSQPIYAERHSSLNSSRGVVNTDALDGMSDDEIQSALAEQFVSRVYHLIGKRDWKPFPLRTIFLTFEVPSMPSHIRVGYERVSVRPCIPNPMRYFRRLGK